jgi:hypothetical protein
MPNLQHEQQRYVMIHIYICVFKRQFFNCYHIRVFCSSNQLFNIGQYRKEGCFRDLIEVLADCFCYDWRKPRPITVRKGGVPAQIQCGCFQNIRLEGYNKDLRNF